ncbi:hypothetical protein NBRC3280_3106 [Acetobacter pasteurianus NBRC 3280]|uniref:Uncharacterized protein n=1 Tax=Acetobacter pasteurianus NBRC 3278 TaxID=1226660 RepID=A0A401X8B8_ACEPA|nr:hypothetical protein [Acetobacter pasteurianus]GCD60447.1 hypothetical protein NBRC3277_3022 [Acetobacter pasteurianus NBRC 3277]GCD64064.1 hypothetical protein NBRC3278_3157 [Acetobacter pasteurianus NBRC 3278]GCD70471.1 hypothetical protein NBRC3280_3106 [Acetobacter pasteurianus NBRC 3280]
MASRAFPTQFLLRLMAEGGFNAGPIPAGLAVSSPRDLDNGLSQIVYLIDPCSSDNSDKEQDRSIDCLAIEDAGDVWPMMQGALELPNLPTDVPEIKRLMDDFDISWQVRSCAFATFIPVPREDDNISQIRILLATERMILFLTTLNSIWWQGQSH